MLLTDLVIFVAGLAIPLAPLLAIYLAETYLLSPGVSTGSNQVRSLVAGGCGALTVLYAWYYVVHGWAVRGGTPGMRLCGLRLLDRRNRVPIGYTRAWLRVAAVLATVATLGLGFLPCLFRRDGKALHDILAGTSLVHRPRPAGLRRTAA